MNKISIQSESLNSTNVAYEYIRNKIVDGIFHPSEKLVESRLAKEIGVSRNTLKNAFLLLEKENLITIEKNKGAKVKSFTLDEVQNYLAIREALEGVIIESAAEHISNNELQGLESILNTMKECIEAEKFDDYSKLNKKFHSIIYDASRNQQAVAMVQIIKTQLIRYHFRTILVPGRNKSSFEEHNRIFRALKNHEVAEAREAITAHVGNVRKTIKDYYQFLI